MILILRSFSKKNCCSKFQSLQLTAELDWNKCRKKVRANDNVAIKMKTYEHYMMTDDQNWCPRSNIIIIIRNLESEEQTTKIANIKMNKFRFHSKWTKHTNPLLLPATTIVGSVQCFNVLMQLKPYFVAYFPLSSFVCLNADCYHNPIELRMRLQYERNRISNCFRSHFPPKPKAFEELKYLAQCHSPFGTVEPFLEHSRTTKWNILQL